MSRRDRLLPAAALAIFLLPLAPIVAGVRLLCFRDAFITHFPIAQWAAARERAGTVPFLNFAASNVEPLLPNPNTVALYPTHLLYRVLSAAAAFDLHLLLHVVWAFFGAALLARRLGASRPASWIGGAAYAFSGPYLSYASAFTNAAAAAAWAPWAIAEAVRLSRAPRARPAAAVAIALGLQLLAGEPAISAWTVAACAIPILAAFASGVHVGVRSAAGAVAAGVLALGIAAPLLLPTRAALPWSFRGEHLFSRDQFDAAANVPARAVENLLPLVFGAPRPLVSGAFWGYRIFDSLQPYLWSLNFGLVPILLILSALAIPSFRRRPAVRVLLAGAAVALLLSFGFRTPLFEALWAIPPLRHFRYPIKFALPAAIALSTLTAIAADHRANRERSRGTAAAALALAALLAAAGLVVVGAPEAVRRYLAPAFAGLQVGADQVLPGIARIVVVDAVCGIAALALFVVVLRRPGGARLPGFLAAALLTLLPAGWPLFVSTPSRPYVAKPALASAVPGPGRTWVAPIEEFAVAKGGTRHSFDTDDIGELIRAGRAELWPLTAIPDGVRYAYDKDPDGSYGFLDRVFSEAVAAKPAGERARLLEAASVRRVITASPGRLPGFRPAAAADVAGRRVFVEETTLPIPEIRAASRVFRRASLSGAVDLVASERFEPAADVVLRGADADPEEPSAPAHVENAREEGNGFSADFQSSAGTVAVFAATYFRYWRATIDGVPAPVEIANGAFCGVRVPPGRHRVALFYDDAPFRTGAIVELAVFAAIVLIAAGIRRKPPPPVPAA